MLIDLYLWLRVQFSAPEHVFYWKKGAAAWLGKSKHDLTSVLSVFIIIFKMFFI
jgi:hypothetical protein